MLVFAWTGARGSQAEAVEEKKEAEQGAHGAVSEKSELEQVANMMNDLKDLMACSDEKLARRHANPPRGGEVKSPASADHRRHKCEMPSRPPVGGSEPPERGAFGCGAFTEVQANSRGVLGEAFVTTQDTTHNDTTTRREPTKTRNINVLTGSTIGGEREPTETRSTNISTGSIVGELLGAVTAIAKRVKQVIVSQGAAGVSGNDQHGCGASGGAPTHVAPGIGAADTNTWSVNTALRAFNAAEILEHHRTLVVVAVADHDEMVNPLEREWKVGALGDVLSCSNAAGVRVPRPGSMNSDYQVACEDMARAITRLLIWDYEQVYFDRALLHHPDPRFRQLVECAQAYRGTGPVPRFPEYPKPQALFYL